ncbi:hypothetical protein ABI59_22215 [Acidobacteria bacterium Mor1]|nr:hypothetical protein ABI59_22215 [Acidobacteria bacterium Mor1]
MLALFACTALTTASAQFVEDDVEVLELFQGDQTGDWYGWVAGQLSDVNGDGVDEILIPAIARDGFAGRVSLYSGATGDVLNVIDGAPGSAFGYSVSDAGDVDNDGTHDYVIGGGLVQVYSGATNALLHDVSAEVAGFAHSVSGVGDVNGDGHDDFMAGSRFQTVDLEFQGRIFVFSGADGSLLWSRNGDSAGASLGSAAGLVGDVNRDGVKDFVVGATGENRALLLDGTNGEILHSLEPPDPSGSQFFAVFFASGAGDVNRDGIGDVFVGDYSYEGDAMTIGRGEAYVFSGRSGRVLHRLRGFDMGDGFGPGRGVSDLNGDGFNDIVVASYNDSNGAASAGASYVFSGRSGALLRQMTATLAGDQFGVDALSVGDTDDDGFPDFVVTAVGQSFNGIDTGRVYLIAGNRLPCTSDIDGNRFVGFKDLLILLSDLGEAGGRSDLNGDGTVDHADKIVLLKDFGFCPRGKPRRR